MNYKLGLTYTGMESSFVPFFLQYLALSAQLPNVIFNWINVFFKLRYLLQIYFNRQIYEVEGLRLGTELIADDMSPSLTKENKIVS